MPSILQSVLVASHQMQVQVKGEGVSYFRDVTPLEITAIRGGTQWDTEQPESGITIEERSVDFLISTSELSLTPQRGDSITDENGVTYRVMPFGPDNQLWRWHDPGRTVKRIFTKERV